MADAERSPYGRLPYSGHSAALRGRERDCPQIQTRHAIARQLRHMEEFLASILARFAYLVAEALIVRLIRAFMHAYASPAGA
jgi:hypothetical protein